MGVNVLCYLPSDVGVREVAEVVGILAGCHREKAFFEDHFGHRSEKNGWYCRVDGAEAIGFKDSPGMAEVIIKAKKGQTLVDGEESHMASFFYEPSQGKNGEREFYPKSSAFWVAVCIRLCQFFGGRLCYSDSDGRINRRFKKPRPKNNPQEGKPWQNFQMELLTLVPLTKKDIEKAAPLSAYGLPEGWK